MRRRKPSSKRRGSVDCGSFIGPEELALIAGDLGILMMFAPILVEEGQAGGIFIYLLHLVISSFRYVHLVGCARLGRDMICLVVALHAFHFA